MRRLSGALLIGALGAVLSSCGTTEADELPLVGFNNNGVTQGVVTATESAELISAVGGGVDRVQIEWATLEPQPGDYDFSKYDAIYRADLAAGVRPLFNFAYAPGWASGGFCAPGDSGCHAAPLPESFDDAAQTVATIARRYPRAAGIEIWNEPNAPYFWAPRPDADAYAKLLMLCHEAVRASGVDIPVAGPSTSNSPGFRPGFIEAADFLDAVYETLGPGWMDAISLHAYPEPEDTGALTAVKAVNEIAAVRDRHGDGETPLWVTETGVTTTGPDGVPDEVQAYALSQLSKSLTDSPGVEMVLVHTLIEPPRGPADRETGFGIVREDGDPKPAYCLLGELWRAASVC